MRIFLAAILLILATPALACGPNEKFVANDQTCVPLTAGELAQRTLDQQAHEANQAARTAEKARTDDIADDPDVIALADKLKHATAAEIDTWVNNNVTDLASARNTLKAIIKLLAYTLAVR
jgi:hypothetical protein